MRPTLLCIFALLAASLFLFSVTDGNLNAHGDDVMFFSASYNYNPDHYLLNILSRAFLTPTYVKIYRALGSNEQRMHVFFLCLHALNTILCFLALRRFLPRTAALAGALFYLVYLSSYEVLTWLSAGGYLIVMFVFFLSVWIAFAEANAWIKGFVIALANWLVVHLYEILLIAAPLYPLITIAARYRAKKKIFSLDLLPTFLPLAALLTHWALIYIAGIPFGKHLWDRRADFKSDPFSLLHALWTTLRDGASFSFGAEHWNTLIIQARLLLTHATFDGWYFALLTIATVAIVWAWSRGRSEARSALPDFWLIIGAVGYLTLLTPLIGVTIVTPGNIPSRLLVLPQVGLSLGIAYLAAAFPKPWMGPLLLLIAGVEGLGMQGVLWQFQKAGEIDSTVREQLRTMHLHPKLHDSFFFSIPPLFEFCRLDCAGLETNGIGLLIESDFGMLHNDTISPGDHVRLIPRQVRRPDEAQVNLPLNVEDGHSLFAFYVTNEGKLKAMEPLELLRSDGTMLKTVSNPQFASLSEKMRIRVRPSAAWYHDGSLELNAYDPALNLQIRGRADASVLLGDTKLASVLAGKQVGFPLALVKRESILRMDPPPPNSDPPQTWFAPPQ